MCITSDVLAVSKQTTKHSCANRARCMMIAIAFARYAINDLQHVQDTEPPKHSDKLIHTHSVTESLYNHTESTATCRHRANKIKNTIHSL